MLQLLKAQKVLRYQVCTSKHAPFSVVLGRLRWPYIQTFAPTLVGFAGE